MDDSFANKKLQRVRIALKTYIAIKKIVIATKKFFKRYEILFIVFNIKADP